jgi:hypothetical protein
MAARISQAEARALGLSAPENSGRSRKSKPVRKRKRTYHTRCVSCGMEFTTEASEERHLADNHHARYENVIERNP